ncbi:hypothetical protein Godav_029108, partial [Gossypium davidsonii]|nr:hypothetical protein [Gossypium davidsonii]MBA0669921.1 hypothetical protein [Gossypium klotzschianum]
SPFLHVAIVGRQCKLDPKIISALVERWRPKTHTFHLSCSECTITLEDVHLQLGLPVDKSVVTRSVQFANWRTLRNNFAELAEDSTEEEREQYAQVYILQIIEMYATMEIHEADRVLQQFRFQQSIHVAPQELDDLHCIDLRQSDTNWSVFH